MDKKGKGTVVIEYYGLLGGVLFPLILYVITAIPFMFSIILTIVYLVTFVKCFYTFGYHSIDKELREKIEKIEPKPVAVEVKEDEVKMSEDEMRKLRDMLDEKLKEGEY